MSGLELVMHLTLVHALLTKGLLYRGCRELTCRL